MRVAEPLAGDVGPDVVFDPGLLLVADPAGFAWKDERGIAVEREQHVNVAMDDFESGGVQDGAFETGVLVSADDKGVEIFRSHAGADVFITAVDFVLTWQIAPGSIRMQDRGPRRTRIHAKENLRNPSTP